MSNVFKEFKIKKEDKVDSKKSDYFMVEIEWMHGDADSYETTYQDFTNNDNEEDFGVKSNNFKKFFNVLIDYKNEKISNEEIWDKLITDLGGIETIQIPYDVRSDYYASIVNIKVYYINGNGKKFKVDW